MPDHSVDIRPRALSQFVTLVGHGDLDLAADALQVTPRALTKVVRELERSAGEPLLRHDKRRLTPTPAGVHMVDSARLVLAAIDRLEGVVRSDRSTLRVAHIAGADTAAVLVEHVMAGHRWMHVDERVVPDHRQIQELRAHRLDVAICCLRSALPEDLDALLLRLDPLVVATRGRSASTRPVDPQTASLRAPRYGAAWAVHDALVDGYARTIGCDVPLVPVPVGSGREVAALMRQSRGAGVLTAASALAGEDAAAAPLTSRQPYLGWHLVWRRGDDAPQLRSTIEAAQVVAAERGWLDLLDGGGAPWLDKG